ncbi:MliC family protein [Deinococcus humi]|jgi:membrane-bound inhibitor of C-type lysozyme|uniref:Membrane-bound inhibitor of C-type lysozyme n=1 Tax=Deinococcus humi TaxID=662880 RepID=A0A7W8K0M0_9DEIO|nr:MliC family protein [Deinococcus humi]MBB5366445.1 membrane-bound inhibitor of C-type lysozyme [Deinococcus humi]
MKMYRRPASLLILTATVAGISLGTANAGGAGAPPLSIKRSFSYICDLGKKISVTYVDYGTNGPMFAVLKWNGMDYGLAEAISASGARYAGLNGPAQARGGLEWWEHQGEATLSTFMDGDTSKTQALLTGCKTN